jgi:hypothetical protein
MSGNCLEGPGGSKAPGYGKRISKRFIHWQARVPVDVSGSHEMSWLLESSCSELELLDSSRLLALRRYDVW